jgi:hypothetical protein
LAPPRNGGINHPMRMTILLDSKLWLSRTLTRMLGGCQFENVV